MRLLAFMLAMLGLLVSPAAGQCVPRAAPDEDFSFPNLPILWEPIRSTLETRTGCDSSTWQLGRPHIQARPSDQGFTVWSFHAINPANLNESVLFRFVMGSSNAYELREATDGYISLIMELRFADGLLVRKVINSQQTRTGVEGRADVYARGWSTWGYWGSTASAFSGSRDGKEMVADKGDDGKTNVYGFLHLTAIAPPRFPCTSNISDPATLQLLPGLGQTNHMPDASAHVNITYTDPARSQSRTMLFDNGIGFHEQMWSDAPLREVAPIWRRGNARLHVVGDEAANHSVVWWEGSKPDGTRFSTAYASMDGTIVKEGCDSRAAGLLAIESNDARATIVIKVAEGMILRLNIEKTVHHARSVSGDKHLQYSRSTGQVLATLGKDVQLRGVAWLEEADFVTPPFKGPGMKDGKKEEVGVEVVEGTSKWVPEWMEGRV